MPANRTEKQKEWLRIDRAANPEKYRERERKWRAAHPEKRRENDRVQQHNSRRKRRKRAGYKASQARWQRKRNLRVKYGLTIEAYDQMLKRQKGVCAICQSVDQRGHRLAVDHDHSTGKIRSLLCKACNIAIGHLGDSPIRLRAMLNYLEKHSQLTLQPSPFTKREAPCDFTGALHGNPSDKYFYDDGLGQAARS